MRVDSHERLVVREHHITFAVKVRLPPFACGNYGQELTISGRVVLLCAVQLPAEVLDRLHAVSLVLLQLSTDCKQAGVGPYLEGPGEVWDEKHRGFRQTLLESGEGLLLFWAPLLCSILA